MGSFSYAVFRLKDIGHVVITLQLRQLILLKKRNKVALILSQSKVRQKLGHSLEIEEIKEIRLFSQQFLSIFMSPIALLTFFVKVTSLTTAAKYEH